MTPELPPLYGEFAVFKRCDNSFHGHLPYEGERRVIQVAWLTSEEEKLRKTKRGKFSRLFKKLFGKLDTQSSMETEALAFVDWLRKSPPGRRQGLDARTPAAFFRRS